MFEVKTSEMGDERSKILRDFLIKSKQVPAPGAEAPKQEVKQEDKPEGEKVVIPLPNAERDD